MQEDKNSEEAGNIEIPIDGTLDLHTFNPRDLKELLPDYLEACREKQILQVRVIHGKGSGFLKKSVLSILSRLSSVASFKPAGEEAGGWGATIVTLKPPEN
ncbi:MAG: DNA mismatch repair protein MutS [Nitrospiraceae bacterium]|nr:MAG: DNA mismatch repair protein MutS [Nitrospiraceae bacterium]